MKRWCMAMWSGAVTMVLASSGCEMPQWSVGPDETTASEATSAPTSGTTSGGGGLVASSRRWVPDVAMPAGFDAVTSRCHSEATMHGGRTVSHLYQGRAGQSELVAFYQQQLPLNGWRAYDRVSRGGQEHLVFTKGVETLRLTIEPWDARANVWMRIDQGRPGTGLSLVP